MGIADRDATINNPIYGTGSTTAYTGTAGTTATLPTQCGAVWVFCSTAAHVKVGVSATAVVDVDMAIPGGVPVVLPVWKEGSRVSAVKVTGGTDGSLYVMPLNS